MIILDFAASIYTVICCRLHRILCGLQQYGITPSMSRKGNPYDNAMAENIFSILKSECIRLYKPEAIHEVQTLINSYIAFFQQRPHSALLQALSFRKTAPLCVILRYPA